MMFIRRILYPVTTLGPHNRIVVWTQGCTKHCEKCENPDLWELPPDSSDELSVHEIATLLINCAQTQQVRSITFSGGDPLEQAADLFDLLSLIRPYYQDILIYTGYTYDELTTLFGFENMKTFQQLCDVLVDGRYVDALNDNCSGLRGSTNQTIHYFNQNLRPLYEDYLAQGRTISNYAVGTSVVSVGIHNKDSATDFYQKELL